MPTIEELRQVRINKIEELQKDLQIDPFPAKSQRTQSTTEFLNQFKESATLAGRLTSLRSFGKLNFGILQDVTGKIQTVFKRDDLSATDQKLLKKLDAGDIIQVQGEPFETKTGEKSILVKEVTLLTKALRPLPEKWHGLKDREERYRRRYLDLITNPESRKIFRKRFQFIAEMRKFYLDKGYLEVDTPALEHTTGGAEAKPFSTHHDAYDIELFLRISLELPLKKLLVGGMEKIFEIGKVFRNEGVSPQHLQEFTMLEAYWAYASVTELIPFVQDLYRTCIKNTFGTLQFEYQGHKLDFEKEWPLLDYRELLIEKSGIDIDKYPDAESLSKIIKEKGIELEKSEGVSRGRLIDQLYKKTARPHIIQPSILINQPLDISPLSKKSLDNPNQTERMQVLIATMEVGNGYSELNDPIDQKNRFSEQQAMRDAGDEEAQMMDEDYIEALEYGMPPTAGFGVSPDRLLTILTNSESVRDVVLFPTMKPKE